LGRGSEIAESEHDFFCVGHTITDIRSRFSERKVESIELICLDCVLALCDTLLHTAVNLSLLTLQLYFTVHCSDVPKVAFLVTMFLFLWGFGWVVG